MDKTILKKQAAAKAVSYIKSGMIVGLGTGTTSLFALQRIAELIKDGKLKNILGIPSSIETEKAAKELNIPLTTLNEHPEIDITIDGADEVAVEHPERREGSLVGHHINKTETNENYIIKGGGGALLREKVLAQASKEEIIIVDESKFSEVIGTKWGVPVEVLSFALKTEKEFLESANVKVTIRKNKDGGEYITDEGNKILDCNFGKINNPKDLSILLNCRAGVVEHGLFINLASRIIIAAEDGVREL